MGADVYVLILFVCFVELSLLYSAGKLIVMVFFLLKFTHEVTGQS